MLSANRNNKLLLPTLKGEGKDQSECSIWDEGVKDGKDQSEREKERTLELEGEEEELRMDMTHPLSPMMSSLKR